MAIRDAEGIVHAIGTFARARVMSHWHGLPSRPDDASPKIEAVMKVLSALQLGRQAHARPLGSVTA